MKNILRDLVTKYLSSDLVVRHLLSSYDDFISTKIKDIIDGFNEAFEISHLYLPDHKVHKYVIKINVENPIMTKPSIVEKDGNTTIMFPNCARLRNLTYAAPMYADFTITVSIFDEVAGTYSDDTRRVQRVHIGKIPIMVRSKYCTLNMSELVEGSHTECQYDYGGYFIVNGNEKVVISQGRPAGNKIYVFANAKSTMYGIAAEVRSVQDNCFSVPKTTSVRLGRKANQHGHTIRVNIHHIKHDIPIVVLFRALGVQSDLDILRHIWPAAQDEQFSANAELMAESIDEGNMVLCQRDAFQYLDRYMVISGYNKEIHTGVAIRMNMIRRILQREFLTHCGEDFSKKAMFLGLMVNRLLACFAGTRKFDDRDSYVNKRIDAPGILMATLFRQYYTKAVKDMKNMIAKEMHGPNMKNGRIMDIIHPHLDRYFKSPIIEGGMKFGLSTGNWGGTKGGNAKSKYVGVAQVLGRQTYWSQLSHLRRVNTPTDRSVRLVHPRKLHGTQAGVICPAETPEGISVGLVNNMALSLSITVASNTVGIKNALDSLGVKIFEGVGDITSNKAVTRVFVNGCLYGTHGDPVALYGALKSLKRRGEIHSACGVVWDVLDNEIRLCTEGGRCIRPFLVLDAEGRCPLFESPEKYHHKSWTEMCIGEDAIIEYMDVDEVDKAMIAMTPECLTQVYKLGSEHRPPYTHLEIDPALFLGVLATNIPFSNHNQAPRNCYQCLWVEENVVMADGSKKRIKDVRIGDEVVVFDPATMKKTTSKVVNHWVKSTDKHMYDITTQNGRSIRTTYDHLFMTLDGWRRAEELHYGSMVAIYVGDKRGSIEERLRAEVGADTDLLYTARFKGDFVFVPIMDRVLCENVKIADITVESEHHSFIGGEGFGVHNSAMGKQAIGVYATNHRHRFDTVGHVLNYPQKPIVQTRIGNLIHGNDLPSGLNVIVAIMVFTGYNQEDSVMLNAGAIQRGMFTSTHYKTYKEQNNKIHSTGEEEIFCRPTSHNTIGMKPYNYGKLREDGFVPINERVDSGDVIIGKCMPQKDGTKIVYKDSSIVHESNEPSYVDGLYTNLNGDGYTFVKVRVRSTRTPCIGDKFCVPPNTEVLTLEYGWIPINTVTTRHHALQMDPATGVADFAKVSNVFEFQHRGRMNHIHGKNVDIMVTDAHKMAVMRSAEIADGVDLVPANKLVGGELFPNRCREADMISPGTEAGAATGMMAYLYGCLTYRGSVDAVAGTVTLFKCFDVAMLYDLGLEIVYENDMFVCVRNAEMVECFRGHEVQPWPLESKYAAIRFLDGFFAHTSKPFKGHAGADMVQMIAIKAGQSVIIERCPENPNLYYLMRDLDHTICEYRNEPVDYRGTVHCIEVPKHVFLVRNNGKVVWTGNSSRHGQKGTVGMIYPQEDMPFTRDGIVPDIIVNPHAIPSRMTIAQLMECIMGKACCANGMYGDGSPFQDLSVADIAKEIEGAGLQRHGNEILYNSRTGQQIETEIFMGPTFYQRLKHMVNDKVHSRSSCGPVVQATRQPTEGRTRLGGLRLGEMETDCEHAHGIAGFAKERFVECSDNYRVFACNKCGQMATAFPERGLYECKPCKNTVSFKELRIPYATKLMFHEIQSMSISTSFTTE